MRVTESLIDQFLYSSDDETEGGKSQTTTVVEGAKLRGSYFRLRDDPCLLQRLYEEADRYPVLTRRQEVTLAQRIEAGDEDAQRELARHNVHLVLVLAKRHTGYGVSRLELAAVGLERVVEIIPGFNWRRGFKFSTYATPYIRGAMKDELRFASTRGKFQEISCDEDVDAAPAGSIVRGCVACIAAANTRQPGVRPASNDAFARWSGGRSTAAPAG